MEVVEATAVDNHLEEEVAAEEVVIVVEAGDMVEDLMELQDKWAVLQAKRSVSMRQNQVGVTKKDAHSFIHQAHTIRDQSQVVKECQECRDHLWSTQTQE